jgi:predicted RNA methylase
MVAAAPAVASPKKTRLTDRQRVLLADLVVQNDRAVFTGPPIDDWAALKKVMIALGGTWAKGSKKAPGGFVFPDEVDAAEVVRLARETGEILDPNAHDFYPTPDALADRVVALADIREGMSVLEPSAGRGALALAVRRADPRTHVVCVEFLETNRAALVALGFTVAHQTDFLAVEPRPGGTYHRVVMNPPFSRGLDARHILHAFGFVKPGGRLVAIASAAVEYRTIATMKALRALIQEHGGYIERNPEGSFREAGTMVGTVTVVLPRREG